jgi:DNA-binding MarR family transcriptional regulator
MQSKPLSRQELEIWHAFKQMGQIVMAGIERDLTEATGLTGADFGVLSRLADLGNGTLRQQALADSMEWHKSRLSHQLTRMQGRDLVQREEREPRVITVTITALGREKLQAARPVHAASVRRWLLDRLPSEDKSTLLNISIALAT